MESVASNPPSAMTEVGDAMGEEITSIDEAVDEDTITEELTACVVESSEVDVASETLEVVDENVIGLVEEASVDVLAMRFVESDEVAWRTTEVVSVDKVGVELKRLVEDAVAVAVGMLMEMVLASDENEVSVATVEGVAEDIWDEVSVLLIASGDALDKVVDVTGVAEEEGPAESVTTYTPGQC
jgi:hypothetical protein